MKTFVFVGHQGICGMLARNLAAAGFSAASGIESADFVFTYCTSVDALETIYFEDEGILKLAAPGTTIVDLSPDSPEHAREISSLCQVNDLLFVEAPLVVRDFTVPNAFGNPTNLVALLAGEEAAIEAARPMLSAIAQTLDLCGGSGMAQLSKCAISIQQATSVIAFIEADALCRSVGAVAGAFPHTERALRLETNVPAARALAYAIEDASFEGTFTVEVLMAELESVMLCAQDNRLSLPLSEAAAAISQLMVTLGGMDMTPAAISLVYRDEDECAKFGLDWSRAQQAYAPFGADDEDDWDDDCDDDCSCGHHHDDF